MLSEKLDKSMRREGELRRAPNGLVWHGGGERGPGEREHRG